ncbi:MAG: transglycosylase SLT domain-containing protein, partial [candidate division Zixibacteria bacterium]|nr:transglycosylase SLT domain-containing protein [candidate division Zixibacteria bacterium]
MAKLDVESDSLLTPEAVRYNRLLDDIIADYRVTLRSLGNLEEDVSSSVMLERFGELIENLDQDTMMVFKSEIPQVVYDIPIVMNDRVKKSIVYFQTVAREAFKKYLRRSKKYTPMMKRIIRKHGLPEDLIYLSLVESGYNPNAYSWARAMGLWQFISSTGRAYGLNRNWWYDERKDPVKATEAACRFLKHLYEEFGSWELAMAAYNGGPGRVRGTIKKQKTIDFWKMR